MISLKKSLAELIVCGCFNWAVPALFRTDTLTFEITTTAPQVVQKTRTYQRFSDAAQDVVDARMFRGIHFRFADEAARRQGARVAHWAFQHHLRPRRGHGR